MASPASKSVFIQLEITRSCYFEIGCPIENERIRLILKKKKIKERREKKQYGPFIFLFDDPDRDNKIQLFELDNSGCEFGISIIRWLANQLREGIE
jgi:hypothetical protein